MKTILYINHETDKLYGSSRSLLNMLDAIKDEVYPIILFRATGAAMDFFQSRGYECIAIPFKLNFTDKHGAKRILSFFPRLLRDSIQQWSALRKGVKILSDKNIDLVHSNSSVISFGHTLSKALGVPHVWHLREYQNLDFGLTPFLGWSNLISKINKSAATISITNSIKAHFHQENKANAYQLYNAVRPYTTTTFSTLKQPYFLLIGNLSPAKGVDLAIKTFALFNSKISNYRLRLCGNIEADYKRHLIEYASDLGISSLIEWYPYTDNVDELYRHASAFLMCSRNEGMGRTTVEAMFSGCPVIGYDNAGTSEVISHGKTGFLFNTVEECCNLMVQVVNEPIAHILNSALEYANREFSIESYSDKILSIYSNILTK